MWSSDQTLMKNFKKGIQMTKLYLLENKLYDFDKIKKGVAVLGNDERKMTKQKDANKPKGRGRTKKNDINNLKAQGRKTKLEWNEKGEPIGTAYAYMQSWIGVKARSTVPLTYDDWRHVDSKLKEKIWKDTYDAFELPETYKPKLLSDAGKMMKSFKKLLTRTIILPIAKSGRIEELRATPEKYPELNNKDWNEFVLTRLTPEFLALSEAQVARARMNLSHHRSSRRGMPNVEQDLKKELGVDNVERYQLWMRARTKNNILIAEYDKEIEQKIGSLIKKLHSSNNSKGKEKCKGKEKIVEHLDSTKSYEKFIAEVLDKTHISLQAICIWENLNQRQKELYKFYDVELLSYNNEQDKVIAINQLSIWLNTMTHVGQYYFIPWNIGKHWMLIIAMTSGRVVFLNPLKSKIPSDIAQMIKAAYANISSNAIVFGKNGPEIWTFACPKQPYNYECGYYVLTYIRDMLQHSNPIEAIKAKFGGLSQYSEDDHLLPLRQQWLNNV
ncbi:hypothetical protein F8388_001427 [Cannabis sativa]|uniref:Ubiquitin-like protease family profile domain-containing protein n=1 Tax=Cannabis sativa TaxID=3483 RepID=A0A7J6GQ14_CANSA|nr:hypothetical protein F8388_001427 [Cannabis sativa]